MISPSHGPDDSAFALSWAAVTDAAERVDGYAPLNEQATLDLAAGRRTPFCFATATRPSEPSSSALVSSTSSCTPGPAGTATPPRP
ncbi:hypothetical protein [Cryobacterium sp. 10C3]|uniref:hypothetical protein n=1 Tax=Cryobacterium sp. 10C3 TaxID=3048577 RepID=UPI002AB4DFA6|nr:hypothetical protein [Cryobacterium sp. 10C3]MDY7558877.1 hypothetical protein [Cryobacterium sp. 10C3]